MKKIILLFLLVLGGRLSPLYAQLGASVVTDPGSYSYYADMVLTGLDQFEKAGETLKEYKKVYNMYTKVNNKLKNVKLITELGQNFVRTKELVASCPKVISSIDNKQIRRKFGDKFERIYKRSEALAEIFNMTIKEGALKGSDSDRMEILFNINEKLEETYLELKSLKAEIYFL